MKLISRIVPLLLIFCLAADFALAAPGGLGGLSQLENGTFGDSTKVDRPHARAELIADVKAIEPGKPFRLGVRFTMDPKWHIYWFNYGDSGRATMIDWQLPAGFKAGALQWPAPERAELFTIVNYGYFDEVVLFAEVTPPASLPPGPIKLGAKTEWLVCDESCIPGKAELDLTLPAGKADPSESAPLLERFASRVPVKASAGKPLAEQSIPLEWSAPATPLALNPGEETSITLAVHAIAPWKIDVEARGQEAPALFPVLAEDWEATNPVRKGLDESSMTYDWPLKPRLEAKPEPDAVGAVVRVPLVNPQTGEKRLVAFSRPVEARLAASAASGTVSSPAAEHGASGSNDTSSSVAAGQSRGAASFAGSPNDGEAGAAGLRSLAGAKGASPYTESIFYYLLLAFFGGMILNVMPCVLPVLSLKVLSLVRQSGEDPARVFRMGLVYGAGVLASFAVLAALVIVPKLAGGQASWGTYFQEPRFIIAISAVVLALALSLFNVYTIELPGSAATKLDAVAGREGYAGSFLNGLLATVLATPCMAPLLGPAVAYSFTQSPLVILLIFLTIGAGLAFPFVLLTARPGWLRFMPKPGLWMETFKQFMGFLLIATLVFLMRVLGSQVGVDGLAWTLALLLLVSFACWVWGQEKSRARTRLSLCALAVLLAVFGYPWGSLDAWGDEIRQADSARLAASEKIDIAAIPATTADGKINWTPFTPANVDRLLQGGRIVFIDFTADWCLTCKVNERGTLASQRVAQLFKENNVASLKADWTNKNPEIGRVLEQLGQSGVPAYVFFDPRNPTRPIQMPTLLNPGLLEEKLKSAAGEKAIAMP